MWLFIATNRVLAIKEFLFAAAFQPRGHAILLPPVSTTLFIAHHHLSVLFCIITLYTSMTLHQPINYVYSITF